MTVCLDEGREKLVRAQGSSCRGRGKNVLGSIAKGSGFEAFFRVQDDGK